MALTNQQIYEKIHQYSAWGAFLQLVKEDALPMSEAIRMMGMMFNGGFLHQAREAKEEVKWLVEAYAYLEGICQLGAAAKTEAQMKMQIDALYNYVKEINEGVVEFYETHLTMYGWIDPQMAYKQPLEIAKAMDALRKRRETEGLRFKDSSMFNRA